jgi:Phosphoribosyl transferase domain
LQPDRGILLSPIGEGETVAGILKNHTNYWGGWLASFGTYKPWGVHRQGGGTWDDFPDHGKNILNFKKGETAPIDVFQAQIEPELPDNIAIVTVPGHDPAKQGKGLSTLAARLASKGNRIDASSVLVRTKKIVKLANGGDRSEKVHAESISAANAHLIKGKDVLLLDDVAKTGNSLRACQKILMAAGARSVECATIGKT